MIVIAKVLLQFSDSCNRLLCHPFQGAVICLLLGAGWAWSGVMRQRELTRQQRSTSPLQSSTHTLPVPPQQGDAAVGIPPLGSYTKKATDEKLKGWPPVTVVLPVKGCRKHSLQSWRSQLGLQYEGGLEFLFVVDSVRDPACSAIADLLADNAAVSARILIATHATGSSQKIHNIQAGIRGAAGGSEYILCLDDDIILHPRMLQDLVAELERDPSWFMATGYPLDLPPPSASLAAHCMLSYHLPLLIAFSSRERTDFIWGGCMLFRAGALQGDTHGIMRAWSDGGYSDDLIVAACCGQHGLRIICPSSAIFPQPLDGAVSWGRYWNYLRRQLFVMDTYVSAHNRRVNHCMLLLHPLLSWGFVIPTGAASLRLLVGLLELALLPVQHMVDGPSSSGGWRGRHGGLGGPAARLSLLSFFTAFMGMALALRWMTGVVIALFKQQGALQKDASAEYFNWLKVWLGFVVNNTLLPFCMVYTYCQPHIEWSGVHYYKAQGRIVRVVREVET